MRRGALGAVMVGLLIGCADAETEQEAPVADLASDPASAEVGVVIPEYPPPDDPLPRLQTEVVRTPTTLQLVNRDTFAWTDCRVELNPITGRGGFRLTFARLEPGERFESAYSNFIRSGQNYRIYQSAVEVVDLNCSTPAGPGRMWVRYSWGDE
jgi:hypothetical protein